MKENFKDYLNDYWHDLENLVAIDAQTKNKQGVDSVGIFLSRYLSNLGCQIISYPQKQSGDHFLATLHGDGSGRILMLGHLDTVVHNEKDAKNIRYEGKKAFGAGIADMKGGLLSACYIINYFSKLDLSGFHELSIFCESDEEIGSPSSKAVIEKIAANYDAALVLEAGRPEGSIVIGRKGKALLEFELQTESSHLATIPSRGLGAIGLLAKRVLALELLSDASSGKTVSVIDCEGKHTPPLSRARVDIRAFTLQELILIKNEAKKVLTTGLPKGAFVTHNENISRSPWQPNQGTEWLINLARDSAREAGFPLTTTIAAGGSSANFTASLGLPTLDGLGPIGGNFHSEKEYIIRESILPRAHFIVNLIKRIGQSIIEKNSTQGEKHHQGVLAIKELS